MDVELDAKVVLNVISSGNSTSAAYSSLLFYCKLLMEKIPHHTVKHVFREANRSVDALAIMGCNLQEAFVFVFLSPPHPPPPPRSDAIAALVSADKNGETFCRHVANLAILAV